MGTRKQFSGTAPLTSLSAAITGSPSNFTVANASGFPTGTGGVPFVVVIDRGTLTEEKILCSSESGNVFTIQTRGFDGTASVNHANGATVEHCIDADTMNDLEGHVYVTTRDDHTQYAKVDGTRAFTGAVTFNSGITVTGNDTETGNLTASGQVQAGNVAVTGLPGAATTIRLAGGTVSGAPSTGTFALGDLVVSQDGTLHVCSGAGSPGTWVSYSPTSGTPIGALVASATGPGVTTNYSAPAGTVMTASVPGVSGQKYLVNVSGGGSQSGTSTATYIQVSSSDGQINGWRPVDSSISSGGQLSGGASVLWTPSGTGSVTFTVIAFCNGTYYQIGANSVQLNVVRVA